MEELSAPLAASDPCGPPPLAFSSGLLKECLFGKGSGCREFVFSLHKFQCCTDAHPSNHPSTCFGCLLSAQVVARLCFPPVSHMRFSISADRPSPGTREVQQDSRLPFTLLPPYAFPSPSLHPEPFRLTARERKMCLVQAVTADDL